MAKFSVCRIYKVTLWLNFSLNCRVGRMEKPESGIQNRNPNLRNKTWRRFCLKSVTNNYYCSIKTFHPHIIFIYCSYSGAPARAKRAWDRAPYSWNMVNLFSFGCHVIDRAYVHTYVRVYRLYGWGRGDYQKEGRGVSGVSWHVHIFNIGF